MFDNGKTNRMKTRLLLTVLYLFSGSLTSIFCQGFQQPAEGKAVVYFVRVTGLGFAVSFEYFHQDKYIGAFKGKGYLRYECDPGENLFWISSENKEFVTADLKPGGTYVVVVDVVMGAMKARVGATPIDESSEVFARAKELVNSKPPETTPLDKIDNMNVKLKKFIEEKLTMYDTKWKNEKNFNRISPEMDIPEESLKK